MEINRDDLDTYSRMYPSIAEMDEFLEKNELGKPYILCEYISRHGQRPRRSGGLLSAASSATTASCGGFVWEWCDHAVYMGTTVDGQRDSTSTAATSANSPTTATSAWTVWSIPTAARTRV